MYVLDMANADILKAEEMNFELLSVDFHSKDITGVDTCIKKPLVVTCSTDKSVRVWNYLDKSVELSSRRSPRRSIPISFHPSGLHVLAGFTDKLRLMNLLMDDIRPYKEFAIKMCRECRFNDGGDKFAAVNGNTIQIYSTYTCENIGNLRGHNGKVKSIYWTTPRLFRAGARMARCTSGSCQDFRRTSENVIKSCAYTCAVAAPRRARDLRRGLGPHPQGDRRLERDQGDRRLRAATPGQINQIALLSHSGRCSSRAPRRHDPLLQVPADRRLHRVPVPLTPGDEHAHLARRLNVVFVSGRWVHVRVRHQGQGRASAEEELERADDALRRGGSRDQGGPRGEDADDEELKTKVEELTMQTEYQLRLKDLNMNEKIKDLTEKFQAELDEDKKTFEMLLQEKNEQEMEYEEKIKQIEENHASQTGDARRIDTSRRS